MIKEISKGDYDKTKKLTYTWSLEEALKDLPPIVPATHLREGTHFPDDTTHPECPVCEEERLFNENGACVRCFATKPDKDCPDLCAACEAECDRIIDALIKLPAAGVGL